FARDSSDRIENDGGEYRGEFAGLLFEAGDLVAGVELPFTDFYQALLRFLRFSERDAHLVHKVGVDRGGVGFDEIVRSRIRGSDKLPPFRSARKIRETFWTSRVDRDAELPGTRLKF